MGILNSQKLKQYNWLFESSLFFTILTAVNVFFSPDNKAYIDSAVNPYLIFVWIMAARYGIRCAVYSAALTVVLIFAWAFPEHRVSVFAETSPPLILSFYICFFGLIIGSMASMHLNKIKLHKKNLDEKSNEVSRLNKDKELLLKVNHELEDRILYEVNSLDQLYQISKGLEGLDIDYTYKKIPEIVCETMNAEKASIYILDSNQMILKENFGWTESMANRTVFSRDKSLMGLAWSEKSVQCIRDFLTGDRELESIGESILAAPLIDNNGLVFGIINIETIPFMEINRTSIVRLRLLSEWFSLVLHKAYLVDHMQDKLIFNEKLGIYKKSYLLRRLKEEFYRSQKYKLPLSLIVLHFDFKNLVNSALLMQRAIHYLEESKTEIDLVTGFGKNHSLAILFSSIDNGQADRKALQLQEDLSILLGLDSEQVTSELCSISEDMENWESMMNFKRPLHA